MGKENQDFLPELGDQEGPQAGPSWGNPRWLEAVKDASAKAGKPTDPKAIENAANLSISAMTLVRLYRVRGHMAADLDPLGLHSHDTPSDLTLWFLVLAGKEDQEVYVGGVLGLEWTTVRELYNTLRATYCSKVGLEKCNVWLTFHGRLEQADCLHMPPHIGVKRSCHIKIPGAITKHARISLQ